MKTVVWAVVIVMAFVFQSTIVPLIFTQNRPDLLLAVVVSSGLLAGREHGVGMGFFSGLLQDMVSGSIGLNMLAKMSAGYLAGLAERKVFKENILLPLIAMMLATLFNGIVSLAVLMLFGYKIDLVEAIINTIIPTLAYNVLVAIPIHQIIFHINARQIG